MSFSNPTATATSEQVDAANATIKLEENIGKFIQQSQAVEQSNQCLTCFIILLSIIQAFSAVIALFK
jgi:hypothetical protein